jgi:hypothetical protein
MLAAIFAIALQTPPTFLLVDEEETGTPPKVEAKYLAVCDVRMIGRKVVVLLDTKKRGLPMKILVTSTPSSLLEFAVRGLGVGGKRVVSDPASGQFAWVRVINLKKVEG